MNRVLFVLFLPGAPEGLLGDLEEEAATRSIFWLLRHVVLAAVHQANILETAAATAFLIGLPLILTLELRRVVLTLIPYRESDQFTVVSQVVLALLLAALSYAQSRALNGTRLAVATATLCAVVIATLTNSPQLLAVAALLGGSLATFKSMRKNQ